MIDLPSPALIGVIHLPPLPGSARHTLETAEILVRAQNDTEALRSAGFDAVIVENFGDAPFSPSSLSPASIAVMAVVARHVRRCCGLPIGINALRNDSIAALGIASASEASFVRVNVHTGVYATDQGMIEGRADETLRYRRLLGLRVAILADVHVKHATPIAEPNIERAAKDTAYRGLADGLIVTGPATGEPVCMEDLTRVRSAVPDRRLFVGSGVTAESVRDVLKAASGVIVGTALKRCGDPAEAIDPALARAFAHAAGRG